MYKFKSENNEYFIIKNNKQKVKVPLHVALKLATRAECVGEEFNRWLNIHFNPAEFGLKFTADRKHKNLPDWF